MQDRQSWYDALAKPGWTPEPSVIGLVWTVLYPVIIVVFGYVVVRVVRGTMPARALVPVALNAVANLAFTPIQFGLRDLGLALVDILVVLATIVWTMWAVWPYSRWAALALVPYLVWVCIATSAQAAITVMNR